LATKIIVTASLTKEGTHQADRKCELPSVTACNAMESLRSPETTKHTSKALAFVLRVLKEIEEEWKTLYNDNLHNISSFNFVRAT
jgi:hypothetical protein